MKLVRDCERHKNHAVYVCGECQRNDLFIVLVTALMFCVLAGAGAVEIARNLADPLWVAIGAGLLAFMGWIGWRILKLIG